MDFYRSDRVVYTNSFCAAGPRQNAARAVILVGSRDVKPQTEMTPESMRKCTMDGKQIASMWFDHGVWKIVPSDFTDEVAEPIHTPDLSGVL